MNALFGTLQRFPPGQMVITPGAMAALAHPLKRNLS